MKEFVLIGTPIWIAHIVTIGAGYFSDYSASGLNNGMVTSISFAQKFAQIPIVLLFTPLYEVINTKFAEYSLISKHFLTDKFHIVMKLFLFLLIPITMFLFFYKREIVTLLLHRGAFSLDNVLITSNCFGIFVISTISTCFLQLGARIFFTFQKTGWTSLFGTIGHLSTIIAIHFFVIKFHYIGIPAGKVFVEYIYFVPYMLFFLQKYLSYLNYKSMMIVLVTYLVFSTMTILTIRHTFLFFFKLSNTSLSPSLNLLLFVTGSLICCIGLYGWLNFLFKTKEMKLIKSLLQNQIFRKS